MRILCFILAWWLAAIMRDTSLGFPERPYIGQELKGAITVRIIEGGWTGEREDEYLINLKGERATVRLLGRAQSSDDGVLFGRISACRQKPLVYSPDQQLIATCERTFEPGFFGTQKRNRKLIVTEAASGRRVIDTELPRSRSIEGFVWAPDSRHLAVLSESTHLGWGPLGLFAALSGHGIAYVNSYVSLFRMDSNSYRDVRVAKNTTSGFSRLIRWEPN